MSLPPHPVAAPHLASSAQADELLELLTPKGSPNGGLGPVTDDVKYGIKLGRQNAIHVTVCLAPLCARCFRQALGSLLILTD